MSFNWVLYISFAKELLSHYKISCSQEACFRSAISRSYYGVFCIARNLLESRGHRIPKKDIHNFVKRQYTESPNMKEKKIGADLDRLRKARNKADYRERAQIDLDKATSAYITAEDILEELKNIGASI